MGNDSGRGSRSDEPPQLANVRRLHLDDVEGPSATATEEWYETERLTGQITGGARSAAPIDPPAPSQDEAPVVLDWRHAAAVAPPTALERLRTLAARRYRRHRRGIPDADVPSPARARGVQRAVLATANQVQPPRLAPQEDEPAADEIRATPPSGPRIGLRESADRAPQRPKRRSAPSASGRERDTHPRLRRGVIVSAVVLSVAAASVIAIASQMNSTAARPRQASPVAATSRPGDAGLNTTAETVIGVPAILEHQVRKSQPGHGTVQAHRHPRHKTHDRTRSSSSQPSVSRSESTPPVAVPATTPSTPPVAVPATTPSTSSYSSSSSSPAYSPQPAISEPAPAAIRTVPQPAGPSGPGGTVGSNCNPKCA
jgi:hypothetical protein